MSEKKVIKRGYQPKPKDRPLTEGYQPGPHASKEVVPPPPPQNSSNSNNQGS